MQHEIASSSSTTCETCVFFVQYLKVDIPALLQFQKSQIIGHIHITGDIDTEQQITENVGSPSRKQKLYSEQKFLNGLNNVF